MVKIQLISDTHLEFKQNIPISFAGDILILAGDIGTMGSGYKQFITECANYCKYVIVITGNHEYWNSRGKDHVTRQIREHIDPIENAWFLQREYVDLCGYRFAGCTMWTRIPQEHGYTIEDHINDYKKIKVLKGEKRHKIRFKDVQDWHFYDKLWMKEAIRNSPLPVVVVTHHSPIFDLSPKPLDYAFHSDLTDMMTEKVVLWCHGHTHSHRKFQVGETTVWSNPVGYPKEETGYVPDEIIEI